MNYLIFVILISSALFKHVKVCQKVRKFTIKNWQKMPQIRGLDAMKYAGLKNIARIANAVQVTIYLLVSTSVY